MENRFNLTIVIIGAIVFVGLIAGLLIFSTTIFEPEEESPKSEAQAPPDSGFKTYTHPGYGLSFDYPADWSVDLFEDDIGEVAVIQNSETGILIYIYPFDEPGPISRERVLKDVPDMKIANGKQIKIAGTIDALSFDSNEREIGPTKEVWFTHNGFLYQISAAAGSEEALNKIVETWKIQ